MIFIAAGMIVYTAIQRFFVPQPIEEPGWGLALSTLSSVLNGAVGIALIHAGKRYRSATLEADGHHCLPTSGLPSASLSASPPYSLLVGGGWIL